MSLRDLVGSIEALSGRVYDAERLSDAWKTGALAQFTVAAFILPLGLRGGKADAASGIYRQQIDRLAGVVLVVRAAGDASGARGRPKLDQLIDAVIEAVAGTAAEEIGVWTLVKGELVDLAAGSLVYQLDFSIEDQLRIVR